MAEAANERERRLRMALAGVGQEHVLRFLPELDETGRDRLLDQVEALDLERIRQLIEDLRRDEPVSTLDLSILEPAEVVPLARDAAQRGRTQQAREAGEALLRQGKVAAFVVAGGQGTRLGYDGPKGCFPIGPVSRCSLFEWHFAKVRAARRRYGAHIPMLVMTSTANHAETVQFLQQHAYFGLPKEDVLVFRQGMLPAVDRQGRLLLEDKDSLALAPDGHGGSLLALARSGALDQLEKHGVEEIFYFQVDNPLVRILDPEFLGYHRLAGAEMSGRAVEKRDAAEKVGVFAKAGGKTGVVEYSDLPEELAQATDANGRLRFWAGSIAVHVISVAFVRRLTSRGLHLPYHRADKKVPYVDEHGRKVEPKDKNGVKFETFVFDALPLARATMFLETLREDEFSPVKNAEGEDSPATARRDLIAQFRRWIEQAGWSAPERATLEIAPSFALDGAELEARLKARELAVDGLWMA